MDRHQKAFRHLVLGMLHEAGTSRFKAMVEAYNSDPDLPVIPSEEADRLAYRRGVAVVALTLSSGLFGEEDDPLDIAIALN